MPNTDRDLRAILESIDRRGYPAYKQTKGAYRFPLRAEDTQRAAGKEQPRAQGTGSYILHIDHVQGDPFASPSHITLEVPAQTAGFPEAYIKEKHRRIALQDFLCRRFRKAAGKYNHAAAGSGKSGVIVTCAPGQEILERTACRIDEATGTVFYRLEIGFPANGRTINARELIKMLFAFLPACVEEALVYRKEIEKAAESVVFLADDQKYLREALKAHELCAFVADGSVLPRQSGISQLPMKDAIPFASPESLKLTLTLPHRGALSGMGVKRGVTLIVGGGYHGKSTLLKALELGVYDHIAGDGREYVVTDDTAVKIRAEDGRSVRFVDISLFIRDLPDKRDTRAFSTEDASGSTSQAANVVEALESGAKTLLIDEDTCATNFMIRDELMQRVIRKDSEPITPFIERIRPLWEMTGLSTVLVAGSFGAFFSIADTVLQMDGYRAFDITESAKRAAAGYAREREGALSLPDFAARKPKPLAHLDFNGRIKTKTLGKDGFSIDRETVELRFVEQIADSEQNTALCRALLYMGKHYFNGKRTLSECAAMLEELLAERSLDALCEGSYIPTGLAMPRMQELYACLNRYRQLFFS